MTLPIILHNILIIYYCLLDNLYDLTYKCITTMKTENRLSDLAFSYADHDNFV